VRAPETSRRQMLQVCLSVWRRDIDSRLPPTVNCRLLAVMMSLVANRTNCRASYHQRPVLAA